MNVGFMVLIIFIIDGYDIFCLLMLYFGIERDSD